MTELVRQICCHMTVEEEAIRGDILESSRRDQFHQPVRAVAVPDQIDQGGSDYMGQVADCGGDVIMLSVIKNQRNGAERTDQLRNSRTRFRGI